MSGMVQASFAGITDFIGGTVTFSRGIRPSRFTLRQSQPLSLAGTTGTLTLTQGPVQLAFTNCAVIGTACRHETMQMGWNWDIVVVDRRWKWKYYTIDGVYNEWASDWTLQTATAKTIKEMMELCLDAMGETGYVTSDVPTTVHPPAIWNRANAAEELQWLCDLVGMVVVLGLDDKVHICKLNDSSGQTLPLLNPYVITTMPAYHKPSNYPATCRVQGDPTIIQSKLTLEAVGLDSDSKIDTLANLSYKPASGWDAESPWSFPSVTATDRWMAYESVYRWYRPSTGWNGDGVTISSYAQLELLDHCVESIVDADGVYRSLPPVVTGTFWPYCDLATNTSSTAKYDGGFHIDKERGLVIFDKPVFKWSSGAHAAATIYITIAYRVRKAGCDGYACYTKDKAVTKAGTGIRVLHHPELTKVKVVDGVFAAASDNLTALDIEANEYLDRIEAGYDFELGGDITYDGLVALSPDGAITQLKIQWGFARAATTRIGRCTEVDVMGIQDKQSKALDKLSQIASRMCL